MRPSRSRFLFDGMVAGLLGYPAVAVVVAGIDLASGRAALQTPSLLGQILIGGFGDPTPGVVVPGAVLAYNGLHLMAFLAIGLGVAWLVYEVELHPVLWYGAFFAVTTAILASFMVLSFVGEPHADVLPRWQLIVANAVAAVPIGGYLHRAHPRLGAEIRAHGDPEYDEEV